MAPVGAASAFSGAVLGHCTLTYAAGTVPTIPAAHYEAARIDGAWQQFRHVTPPLLNPTTFLLLILMLDRHAASVLSIREIRAMVHDLLIARGDALPPGIRPAPRARAAN